MILQTLNYHASCLSNVCCCSLILPHHKHCVTNVHTLQSQIVPGKIPLDRSGEHDVMFLTCEDDDNSHNINQVYIVKKKP